MKFEPTPANIIAKIISGVVHPMLIPVIGTYIILGFSSPFVSENSDKFIMGILGLLAVCTLALPAAVIVLLKFTGAIQSVSLNDQKDRRIPFIATAICYAICYYFIKNIGIPRSLFPYNMVEPLILGATVLVLLALIVNNWFKISIHMMSIGGLLGGTVAIAFKYQLNLVWYIIPITLIAGLTGFARLQLNAHTPAQVYSGFLTGAIVNGGLVLLYATIGQQIAI